jgi:hypothetical protein
MRIVECASAFPTDSELISCAREHVRQPISYIYISAIDEMAPDTAMVDFTRRPIKVTRFRYKDRFQNLRVRK